MSNLYLKTPAKGEARQRRQISKVLNKALGIQTAKKILYERVDSNTALFLSGGRTPKDFLTSLASEKKLIAGAIGLVDERFGSKLHKESNEKMIQNTGFLEYLESRKIPFYPILSDNLSRAQAAGSYEETVTALFSQFPKRVAILGIGADGHIAGIPANEMLNQASPDQHDIKKGQFVVEYNDKEGFYKERITMTFKALSAMDLLLVLVFGKEKKYALQLMLQEGSYKEIPARFLRQYGIVEKTILITDQTIL